ELAAFAHVAARGLVGALGGANRAGGDVDAPPIQTLHGETESFAFLAEAVFHRHPDVLESDRTRGLAVPAHLVFLAAVGDAVAVGGHHQGPPAARTLAARAGHDHQGVGVA